MPENMRPDPKEMDAFKAGLLGQLQDLFEQITDKEEKVLADACIKHLTAEDFPGARIHRNTYNESEEDNADN